VQCGCTHLTDFSSGGAPKVATCSASDLFSLSANDIITKYACASPAPLTARSLLRALPLVFSTRRGTRHLSAVASGAIADALLRLAVRLRRLRLFLYLICGLFGGMHLMALAGFLRDRRDNRRMVIRLQEPGEAGFMVLGPELAWCWLLEQARRPSLRRRQQMGPDWRQQWQLHRLHPRRLDAPPPAAGAPFLATFPCHRGDCGETRAYAQPHRGPCRSNPSILSLLGKA